MRLKNGITLKNKNARLHIAKDTVNAIYVVMFVRLLQINENGAFDGYENTPIRSICRSRNGMARIMVTTLTMSYEAFEALQHLMGHALGIYGERFSLQRKANTDLLEVGE